MAAAGAVGWYQSDPFAHRVVARRSPAVEARSPAGSRHDGAMAPPDCPVSILDLAIIDRDASAADAFAASVTLAQHAEARGFQRVWYAEHHNMASIASSATSVLIAHVAAQTTSIRLGAGGIMLPNHSPLVIAEQFGTLAALHPGRIDLGLGRAPGSDQRTMHALRRSAVAAERFPDDVLELQGYLAGTSRVQGVAAVPGAGTHVPIYILGSSLFGAQLAAALGLPYAIASHFAPKALEAAVALYRAEFRASDDDARPYVIAAMNLIVADDDDRAEREFEAVRRARVKRMLAGSRTMSDDEVDEILASPEGRQLSEMMKHRAVGTPAGAADELRRFAKLADADEVMVVPAGINAASRLESVDRLADAWLMR